MIEHIQLSMYTPDDCERLLQLFYDTVHTVNAAHYSIAQLKVWAPSEPDRDRWNSSLMAHFTIVAKLGDSLIGFGDIDVNGYLDRLYIHKDYQRRGVAARIVQELERYALTHDIETIETDASITAVPAFEAFGYKVVTQQLVERQDQVLINYRMMKHLTSHK